MKLHQSGDRIIVTELRPMSDAPRCYGHYILALLGCVFVKVSNHDESWMEDDGICYDDSDLLGWIPMPEYQPNAASHDKAALYEKLRRMSPGEFKKLVDQKVWEGKNFDELVAAWPETI